MGRMEGGREGGRKEEQEGRGNRREEEREGNCNTIVNKSYASNCCPGLCCLPF